MANYTVDEVKTQVATLEVLVQRAVASRNLLESSYRQASTSNQRVFMGDLVERQDREVDALKGRLHSAKNLLAVLSAPPLVPKLQVLRRK